MNEWKGQISSSFKFFYITVCMYFNIVNTVTFSFVVNAFTQTTEIETRRSVLHYLLTIESQQALCLQD